MYLKNKTKQNQKKKKKRKNNTWLSVDAIWEGISVAEAVEHNDVPVFDYNFPPPPSTKVSFKNFKIFSRVKWDLGTRGGGRIHFWKFWKIFFNIGWTSLTSTARYYSDMAFLIAWP